MELLHDVVAAGGRLDLGPGADSDQILRMQKILAQSAVSPEGQRLAQEPTRMDPVFGVTVYLEPDFAALTAMRLCAVPGQLRDPHSAVVAFRDKKNLVSKAEVGRAARILQALVTAAITVGWKVTGRPRNEWYGSSRPDPDLVLRLPSQELVVSIRELDQRGRRATAFVTQTDYYTNTTRTIANKSFEPSGKLEIKLSKKWEDQTVLPMRDEPGAPLENQLPTLIRTLEIAEAEAEWTHKEEERRAEIRKVRWEEVKQEAFGWSPMTATVRSYATRLTAGTPRWRCGNTPTKSIRGQRNSPSQHAPKRSSGRHGFDSTPTAPIRSTGRWDFYASSPPAMMNSSRTWMAGIRMVRTGGSFQSARLRIDS